jgi:hypothetical protein
LSEILIYAIFHLTHPPNDPATQDHWQGAQQDTKQKQAVHKARHWWGENLNNTKQKTTETEKEIKEDDKCSNKRMKN